ncbi:MAG: type II toxin-antitoxin system RelE/ParE family toxin [Nitrospira sp.]|nr:type II toxin-antitoxin system RelE/ParE family toxin [Nitrospira sp.]
MGTIIMGHVIRSFEGRGTEEIFDGVDSEIARKTCPRNLWKVARRKLDQINRVKDLIELAVPPGNCLERLRADRSGQHSIRINDQYRICFRWEAGDAYEVEITDYH